MRRGFKTTRKYMVMILSGMVLVLLISACASGGRAEQSGTSDGETGEDLAFPSDQDSEAPSLSAEESYKAVLLGKEDFIHKVNVKREEAVNIKNIREIITSDSSLIGVVPCFAIIDLDDDGEKEVVLWLALSNNVSAEYMENINMYVGFEVLRYQDGVVYGYMMYYRAFNQLKEDGTFYFSSSSTDGGTGKLQFTEDEENVYMVDELYRKEGRIDSDGKVFLLYSAGGEPCSKEEYDDALKLQDAKPDVIWYDFTGDNIDIAFENAF